MSIPSDQETSKIAVKLFKKEYYSTLYVPYQGCYVEKSHGYVFNITLSSPHVSF